MRSIHLDHPDSEPARAADQYEVIGEKISYRLIQNLGSYEVLKVHRPVVKIKQKRADPVRAAPAGVIRRQSGRCELSRRPPGG